MPVAIATVSGVLPAPAAAQEYGLEGEARWALHRLMATVPQARVLEQRAYATLVYAGQPEDAKIASALADPFMFQEYYRDRAPDYLAKEFGPQFALAVAMLPPGSSQGPIESGFGWHLVFVDTAIPGRVPAFEEVEPDVRTAWLGEQKALGWEKAYQGMRANYTMLLPAPPEGAAPPPSSVGTK